MKAKKVTRLELLQMIADANKAEEARKLVLRNHPNPKDKLVEMQHKISIIEKNKLFFTKDEYIFLLQYVRDEVEFIFDSEEQLVSTINGTLNKDMLIKNKVVEHLLNEFNYDNDFEYYDELQLREKLAKSFILNKNKNLLDDDNYNELKEEIEDSYHVVFGKLKNPILI
jgi:hypothetical protein